jgi:predicted HTH transcriptional regulator
MRFYVIELFLCFLKKDDSKRNAYYGRDFSRPHRNDQSGYAAGGRKPFIDAPPTSRNEKIALLMRRFEICEQRGSGIDRAIRAIENAYLPAPEFIKVDNYTKVSIYPKRTFSQMSNFHIKNFCKVRPKEKGKNIGNIFRGEF